MRLLHENIVSGPVLLLFSLLLHHVYAHFCHFLPQDSSLLLTADLNNHEHLGSLKVSSGQIHTGARSLLCYRLVLKGKQHTSQQEEDTEICIRYLDPKSSELCL